MTSYPEQEGEKTRPTDQVKGLGQIDKGRIKRTSLFAAFLLQLPDGEHHADR